MVTQKKIWINEHTKQETFTRMHSEKPSAPIPKFIDFLIAQGFIPKQTEALDIGCGKGRNSIYIAQRGFKVCGADFVPQAVEEAIKRASNFSVSAKFEIFDISKKWPYKDNQFGAIIDCNSTICIPYLGRANAIREAHRVLRSQGYYFFYGVGPTEVLRKLPGTERNSGIFPKTGKFEKQYSKEELLESYRDFEVVSLSSIDSSDIIEGQDIKYSMWVAVFRKK